MASSISLWYEENLRGKVGYVAAGVVAAALVALYYFDVLPERVAGLLVGIVVILICGVLAFVRLAPACNTLATQLVATGLVLAVVVSAAIPIYQALVPGDPLVRGAFRAAGDSVELPAAAHGPVRILLHGVPAGNAEASVDVDLEVGEQHITGHLSRTIRAARVGRRGRTEVVRDHDEEYLSASVPAGAARIRLAELSGTVAGPVEINVFGDLLPPRWHLGLAIVLLLIGAVMAARLEIDASAVAAIAFTLAFGLMARFDATPETAVRPEIGDLFISMFIGGFGGAALLWVVKQLPGLRPRTAGRTAKS